LYAQRSEARKASGEQRVTRAVTTAPAPNMGATKSLQSTPVKGASSAKAVRTSTQSPEGRILISFGSGQKYIALPDIGADDNTVPVSLLKELEQRDYLSLAER
jgi:hypothetical protein